MASADLAAGARRDWPLANPWPWMAAGLLACGWAWAWARVYGERASDNRIVLLALGLLAAGAAVALRLNSSRPAFLGGLPAAWQRRLTLVLAGLFGLLALAVTGLLVAAFAGVPDTPVYPGLASVLWAFLAPLSVAAAARCLGRVRHREAPGAAEEAALLLWLAALGVVLSVFALDLGPAFAEDWDSIRLFLRSATIAILVGAGLAACSPSARRLEISALILFHFGGITTACLAAAPTPWIITQLWIRIYRPYLEFMYLNNAYHFYAPEPGPASFVWFRLIYADADGKEVGVWHKVPQVDGQGRPLHSAALEYQRYLAMTEGTVPTDAPPPAFTVNKDGQPEMAPAYRRRLAAVPGAGIVIGLERPALAIPFDPLVAQAQQYMVPSRSARFLLESFARHAATLPHPDDPDRYHIKRVKIYRVIHAIPSSAQIAAAPQGPGQHPAVDPIYFRPFYLGEYSPDGKLLDPDDPFLYWLLPIMRVQRGTEVEIHNYAARHAGDPRWVRRANSDEWIAPEQNP